MAAKDTHPSPRRKDDADTQPRIDTALDLALRQVRQDLGPAADSGRRAAAERAGSPGVPGSGSTPEENATDNDTAPTALELELGAALGLRPVAVVGEGEPLIGVTRAREGEADPDRRETLVLEALLRQIPGFDALALYKLGAAGLNRFADLSLATAEQIAAAAGVGQDAAAAAVVELARWSGGLASAPLVGEAQTAAWRTLERLLGELEASHVGLERASSVGWSREQIQNRRRARQQREKIYLSIQAALATVGELDLLWRLEKLPHPRRIDELHRLLRAGAAAGVLAATPKSPMGDTPNGRTYS